MSCPKSPNSGSPRSDARNRPKTAENVSGQTGGNPDFTSPKTITGQSHKSHQAAQPSTVPYSHIPLGMGIRDKRESIRIILGPEESEILRDAGECFAVIGKASYPDNPRRYALHLVPCSIQDANKAAAVARGELLTRKKPTK
jgi:hypothetical protein